MKLTSKHIAILGLLMHIPSYTIDPDEKIVDQETVYQTITTKIVDTQPRNWQEKFGRSFKYGILIGGITGTCFGCIDATVGPLLWPATFYAAFSLRTTMIQSLIEHFEDENLPHNKHILHDASWISSWASWFMMMRLLA